MRKAADPLRVARAGAADLLVIKAQPLGGVRAERARGLALLGASGWAAIDGLTRN